jgi:DNA invertase Pin-like site-specific DNA recombinase
MLASSIRLYYPLIGGEIRSRAYFSALNIKKRTYASGLFADMRPMSLTAMRSVAEFESRLISERTRDVQTAAKPRRVKLGGIRPNTLKENARAKAKALQEAEKLRGVLTPMIEAKMPLRAMAEALAGAGKTTKNGQPLSPTQVKRIVERLGLI